MKKLFVASLFLFLSLPVLAETIKSKKILRCQQNCEYTELTWTDDMQPKVVDGILIDSTTYYCTKPEHWDIIIRFLGIDLTVIMLHLTMERKCFHKPAPQEYIATELIYTKNNATVYKAEWLYNEPEEMYILQVID